MQKQSFVSGLPPPSDLAAEVSTGASEPCYVAATAIPALRRQPLIECRRSAMRAVVRNSPMHLLGCLILASV
jgi:hypothetical protein